MDPSTAAELQDILRQYDLGDLVDYERNERGFVNTAYALCTLAHGERKRYFLRKYKRGAREQEIIFEHSLIEHLLDAGAPVARIHHTRAGQSYVRRAEAAGDSFYTIFDYLPGEDRFTWVDPMLTADELAASALVLAQIHMDAAGFTPAGRRVEPRIAELLPIIADTWSRAPSRSKGTAFDARIAKEHEAVQASIAATQAAFEEPGAGALPQMLIHCDYHPGNLKFSASSVTGLFDFDWSKLDFRLFDVGLALWYFCTSWQSGEDGTFRLPWAQQFLHAYQQGFLARPGSAPITPEEARYLPTMINAGNLYVLHWTVLDYFAKEVDPVEYVRFLDHSLHFVHWYGQSENRQALAALGEQAARAQGHGRAQQPAA